MILFFKITEIIKPVTKLAKNIKISTEENGRNCNLIYQLIQC